MDSIFSIMTNVLRCNFYWRPSHIVVGSLPIELIIGDSSNLSNWAVGYHIWRQRWDLCQLFAMFGTPESIVSGNGPQFAADEFHQFYHLIGVKHHRVAPYPSSNSLAERAMQFFKQGFPQDIHWHIEWLPCPLPIPVPHYPSHYHWSIPIWDAFW